MVNPVVLVVGALSGGISLIGVIYIDWLIDEYAAGCTFGLLGAPRVMLLLNLALDRLK